MDKLQDLVPDFMYETSSLMIIAAIGLLSISYFLLQHYFFHKLKREQEGWLVTLFHRFKRPAQLLFFLTILVVILQNLVADLDEQVWYQKAYAIAVIGILSWMAIKGINLAGDMFLRRYNDNTIAESFKARQVYTQIRVLRRIVVTIIIFVGIACCLMVFEEIRALGVSLIASAGVGAIVLGLAAQKTLGNFFTGFQIAITQPIRIGDAVIVEGEWGTIEEINLTYVVVKIWDLRRLILPINYFVDNTFQNWTRHSSNLLGPVVLHVDYAMPVDALRAELNHILETDEQAKSIWDGTAKVVQVVEASEKTMEIRVLVGAPNAGAAWNLRCIVRERLIAFIQKNYPQCLPVLRLDNKAEQGFVDEEQIQGN